MPNVYITYQVGGVSIVDEGVSLKGFAPTRLVSAEMAAEGIRVFSEPNRAGAEYYRGNDFDIWYDTDASGQTITSISRSRNADRWAVVRDPIQGFVNYDGGTVSGAAHVSGLEGLDYPVVGHGQPSGIDSQATHENGAALAVAAVSSSDVEDILDSGDTAIGIALPSAVEIYTVGSAFRNAVLADAPVAYYRMGELSGAAMVDEINSPTNDGTYLGSPTLGASGATADGNKSVDFLSFNNGKVAKLPAVSALHPSDTSFSFECWFKFDIGGAGNEYLVDFGLNDFCVLATQSTGMFAFGKNTSPGSASTLAYTSSGPSDTSSFHHLVVTKSGVLATDSHMFIDGVEVSYTGRFAQTIIPNTGSQIYVAAAIGSSSNYFSGKLDEIAIYNYALSSGQVATHYAAR